MRPIGFSTGALARGDFRRGLELQRQAECTAVELSALRETELPSLIAALPELDLTGFNYVSIHVPSRLSALSEADVVAQLQSVRNLVSDFVVHPDILQDYAAWRDIEDCLLLENMDRRKPVAQTAAELQTFFDRLPAARFCFDIGHALQTDPSAASARGFLETFSDRLAELHVSDVNAASRHVRVSENMRTLLRLFVCSGSQPALIPPDVPVIIESDVSENELVAERDVVRAACSP